MNTCYYISHRVYEISGMYRICTMRCNMHMEYCINGTFAPEYDAHSNTRIFHIYQMCCKIINSEYLNLRLSNLSILSC